MNVFFHFKRDENIEDYVALENRTYQNADTSFHAFLIANSPEYISVVSKHWLSQARPSREIQVIVSTIFFVISLVGNSCQMLVFIAYSR